MTEQQWISSADAARMMGDKPGTWRKRVERGLMPEPFARIGNLYYYRYADIRFFCENGRWPAGMKFKAESPAPQPAGSGPA